MYSTKQLSRDQFANLVEKWTDLYVNNMTPDQLREHVAEDLFNTMMNLRTVLRSPTSRANMIQELSKTPAFVNPSSCNLFTSFGSTLFIKLLNDVNFPFFSLSLTILEIASYPTFLIAPKP